MPCTMLAPYVVSMDGIAQFYNEKINGRYASYEILASAGSVLCPICSFRPISAMDETRIWIPK